MELNVASRACEVFGLLREKGPDGRLSGHSEAEWTRFGQSGFEVFRHGQEAVTKEMERLLSSPGADRRFFSRVYGPFTTWLNDRGLGDEFEPLRDLVRGCIFNRFAVRRGILVLGRQSPGFGRHDGGDSTSLADMSESLCSLMRKRGLVYLADDGTPRLQGFAVPAMVVAMRAEHDNAEHDNLVDMASAAALLGLPRPDLQGHVDTGTLIPQQVTPAGDGLFDRSMLRAWYRRLNTRSYGDDARYELSERFAPKTVAEVMRQLKITRKTVFCLIENGFLNAVRGSSALRAGTAAVDSLSLAAFGDVFVSIGHLSVLSGIPQGALAMRLRNADVATLAMPPSLSRIYRRDDIDQFGLPLLDLKNVNWHAKLTHLGGL